MIGGKARGRGTGSLKKKFFSLLVFFLVKKKGGGGEGVDGAPRPLPRILLCCPNDIFVLEIDNLLYSNVAVGKRGKLTWLVFLSTNWESNAKLIAYTDLPRRDRVLD